MLRASAARTRARLNVVAKILFIKLPLETSKLFSNQYSEPNRSGFTADERAGFQKGDEGAIATHEYNFIKGKVTSQFDCGMEEQKAVSRKQKAARQAVLTVYCLVPSAFCSSIPQSSCCRTRRM